MAVPMLDLHAQYAPLEEQVWAKIKEVFASKQFILGPEVEALEKELGEFLEGAHCICVSSGSDALLMALMALDVGVGDEVITTPFSFFATLGAILRLKARPVFADIDPEDFNLSPKEVERKLTPKTKVILPVHLYGQCAPVEVLKELSPHTPLVEDAAQALGASRKGKKAGTLGDIGCISFYPTKNLGGITEGGLCITQDAQLAKTLRLIRTHGAEKGYLHEKLGGNFRMNALNAAVLRVKLPYLEQWNSKRRQNAKLYCQLFQQTDLLDKGKIRLPRVREGNTHIYHQFVLQVEERDKLRAFLAEKGIQTAVYYPLPLHLQPCLRSLGYQKGDFPVAEEMAQKVLALPIYPELKPTQIEEVVGRIVEFYRSPR